MDYETKDSGQRRDFPTGARRDLNKGKGRYDLLPAVCIERLAKLYERGAAKYGDNNWQKGIPSTCYMESALRHLFKYLDGHRDEDHLAACVFNVFGLMWNEVVTTEQHDLKQGQRKVEATK